MADYQYFQNGSWRARVPVALIEDHCRRHDHYFCVPGSLLLECRDELLRTVLEERLSREAGVPVRVVF